MKSYNMFKNGVLPATGGWLDQSNKFNEIMLFIDNEIQNHQRGKNG